MTVRTVEQWQGIIGQQEPLDAARRILGDITHYRHGCSCEDDDIQQLANALRAYAKINPIT